MGCRSGTAHKWLWTPPSSAPSHATAQGRHARTLTPLPPRRVRAGAGLRKLQSSSAGLRVRVRRMRNPRSVTLRKAPESSSGAASSLWRRSALATLLLELPGEAHDSAAEPETLHELLADARWRGAGCKPHAPPGLSHASATVPYALCHCTGTFEGPR